jgi:hypothetical protein
MSTRNFLGIIEISGDLGATEGNYLDVLQALVGQMFITQMTYR